MDYIFKTVTDLSIAGSISIPFILIFRRLTKSASYKYAYFSWFIMFFNLLIPLKISIRTGSLPSYISKAGSMTQTALSRTIFLKDAVITEKTISTDCFSILSYIWFTVFLLLLMRNIIKYFNLKQLLKNAVYLYDNIYLLNYNCSPFTIGIIKPRIYLTGNSDNEIMEHILKHEMTHLKHRDNIWKPLMVLLSCIHWFNPAVWLSAYLFENDMENFCDEVTVKSMAPAVRKKYALTLLYNIPVMDKSFSAGFNVKKLFLTERMVNIMKNKTLTRKKEFFMASCLLLMAILLCITPKLKTFATEASADTDNITYTYDDEASPVVIYTPAEESEYLIPDEYSAPDFITPVNGSISAPFGTNELNSYVHSGIDFAAPKGTPVYASADGTVTDSGYDTKSGSYIVITHDEHYKSYYCHCSELLVNTGDIVTSGTLIAKVGCTGMATGPHLHFAISCDDVFINPVTDDGNIAE